MRYTTLIGGYPHHRGGGSGKNWLFLRRWWENGVNMVVLLFTRKNGIGRYIVKSIYLYITILFKEAVVMKGIEMNEKEYRGFANTYFVHKSYRHLWTRLFTYILMLF